MECSHAAAFSNSRSMRDPAEIPGFFRARSDRCELVVRTLSDHSGSTGGSAVGVGVGLGLGLGAVLGVVTLGAGSMSPGSFEVVGISVGLGAGLGVSLGSSATFAAGF